MQAPNNQFMQPQIILLKEGTDQSQGKAQVISNINACTALLETVKTTLGPRGSDKLIISPQGKVLISNDGATVMKNLMIVHPAVRTLVDISNSQDAEVGDGTTSVVIMATELLKAAAPFIEDGLHPGVIIRAYRKALSLCLKKIQEVEHVVKVDDKDHKDMLLKCAATALNSKLLHSHREFFAKIAVDAVLQLGKTELLSLDDIGVKKVVGGALEDSMLIQGVAFKKTFAYAGFEQQPKHFKNPKIALLNVELELKSEAPNAEVRLNDPDKYKAVVEAEWDIIYSKLKACVDSGANIVLSKLPIGDLATQYFADRGIFCAGRVDDRDLKRVALSCGGTIQTSLRDLKAPGILGTCGEFEERQIGGERYNFFMECSTGKSATIILRGGAEQFVAEAERSLHDSIMIVRRAIKNQAVVGGGGAIQMILSKYLRDYSRSITSREQLMIMAFGKCFEIIPRVLSTNAGFDSTEILNKLRYQHAKHNDSEGVCWYGVDINNEDITDTFKEYIWEPSMVVKQALKAAVEAASLILLVDETVRAPQAERPPQ